MAKVSKQKANYRRSRNPEKRCQTCANFSVVKGFGVCRIVAGNIDPKFVSNFWTPDFFPTRQYKGRQGSLRPV